MFENISGLVRNPLGIIALFISLIYGMSALLLGATVSNISQFNQNVLVWFIVLFPVATLAVFSWLVAGHHNKLYGPGDYRTDESFLNAANRVQPGTIGVKLEQEGAEAGLEAPVAPAGEEPTHPQPAPENENIDGDRVESEPPKVAQSLPAAPVRRSSTSLLYTAQNLALQELENSIGGSLAREVRLPDGTSVDGIIKTVEATYIVEIKFVSNQKNAPNVAAEGFAAIERVRRSNIFPERSKYVLVFIIRGLSFEETALSLRNYFDFSEATKNEEIDIRYFHIEYLLRKYNIDSSLGVRKIFNG